jgi:hypothetical protein
MGSVVFFIDDDTGYLRWLANHTNGYVINTRRSASPAYMVLHRATCPTISDYAPRNQPGAFTERQYAKVCSEKLEDLRAWLQAHGRPDGTFTSEACPRCWQSGSG